MHFETDTRPLREREYFGIIWWCALIEMLCRMSAYPASPDPIDWEYYKAKISKSSFVDSFKKQVL